MATIRKRGKWQAQVRRSGHRGISRSFILRKDAVAWAREMEVQADRSGLPAMREDWIAGKGGTFPVYRGLKLAQKLTAQTMFVLVVAAAFFWSCSATAPNGRFASTLVVFR